MAAPKAVVGVSWLQERIASPGLCILDASWYLPADDRDCRAEHAAAHIPGAVFFDIDTHVDRHSDLPHMLPPPEQFTTAMRELGINQDDHVVVYDSAGLFSAARAWWMLRVFGHGRVSVLDGGLPAWKLAGGALVSTAQERAAERPSGDFTASTPDATLLRSLQQVRHALAAAGEQILDARPAPRFRGEVPEPRPGLRAGHMPGALNLPYAQVLDPDTGLLLPPDRLRQQFLDAGVDLQRPLVTSCGSGVSACILSLALAHACGIDAPVYDGSWAEWGREHEPTPVEPAQ